MAGKTFNRGKLLKLAKAGKLVAVDSYHFDDMFGVSSGAVPEKPVVVSTYGAHEEGKFNVFESDFKSKSGGAYQGENGLITLYVHSNCNYTLKIVEEPASLAGV